MKIHLRYHHPGGGSKDWIVKVLPDGIEVRWGKTNQVRQRKFFPAAECHPSPYQEAQRRADEKRAKGYRDVQKPMAPPPPPETEKKIPSEPKTQAAKKSAISLALKEWGKEKDHSWF